MKKIKKFFSPTKMILEINNKVKKMKTGQQIIGFLIQNTKNKYFGITNNV